MPSRNPARIALAVLAISLLVLGGIIGAFGVTEGGTSSHALEAIGTVFFLVGAMAGVGYLVFAALRQELWFRVTNPGAPLDPPQSEARYLPPDWNVADRTPES